jgi:hypothetical protein
MGVAVVQIVGMATVLHGGVATVRTVGVPAVIGVLAMCCLGHGSSSGPFLNVANSVLGDVSYVIVLKRVSLGSRRAWGACFHASGTSRRKPGQRVIDAFYGLITHVRRPRGHWHLHALASWSAINPPNEWPTAVTLPPQPAKQRSPDHRDGCFPRD